MKFQLIDKYRNLIFLSLTAVIIICLFVVNSIANKQDKAFAEESNQYKYALQLLSENKVTDAEPLISSLAEKHPNNHEILWRYGVVQLHLQNYEHAQALFQQAQDQNVTLVKDPVFLAQYGEVLFKLDNIQNSQVYLNEALKQNPNKELADTINALLTEIQKADQQ